MKLRELEGELIHWDPAEPDRFRAVDTVGEANGVWFLCPKCFRENDGPVGTHRIICWAPEVPLTQTPGPGRWNLVGTGLDDLSLVAGSSSIQLTGGCQWHGWVKSGTTTEV